MIFKDYDFVIQQMFILKCMDFVEHLKKRKYIYHAGVICDIKLVQNSRYFHIQAKKGINYKYDYKGLSKSNVKGDVVSLYFIDTWELNGDIYKSTGFRPRHDGYISNIFIVNNSQLIL
jgi:hypothetical protein